MYATPGVISAARITRTEVNADSSLSPTSGCAASRPRSEVGTEPDTGGFKFGTRFALTWGAALRYVPNGSRYQLRADFSNRLTSIRYPDVYFRPPATGLTPILTGKDQSVWRNNPSLTIGISYLFSR